MPHVRRRRNASNTWRGIHDTWDTLMKGTRWIIGNGRSTHWGDVWLPTGVKLEDVAFRPVPTDLLNRPVCDFICSGAWNLNVLNRFLPSQVVKDILCHPIPQTEFGEDVPSWNLSTDGLFSTKSAYLPVSNANVYNRDQVWDKIWKMEGPQRLRCFLWSVLRGGLKTNYRRFRCKIASVDKCPLCNNHTKTEVHILRDCPLVCNIWHALSHSNRTGGLCSMNQDLRTWVFDNLSLLGNRWRHVYFVVACWSIWKARNEHVFANKPFNSVDIIRSIDLHVNEIRTGSHGLPHMVNEYKTREVGWLHPNKGWVKCNMDGSLKMGGALVSCGGAFWNSVGSWVGGFAYNLGSGTVLTAELQAILSAMYHAHKMQISHLWIESDSKIALQLVNNGYLPSRRYAPLLQEIDRLRREPWHVVISHGLREGNRVADWLANFAHNLSPGLHTFDSPPHGCISLIWQDIVEISFPRRIAL